MTMVLYKRSDESRLMAFVFTAHMEGGGSITSLSEISIEPSPSSVDGDIRVDNVDINGAIVQALFSGGYDGMNYKASCRVRDDSGQILEVVGLLSIRDDL